MAEPRRVKAELKRLDFILEKEDGTEEKCFIKELIGKDRNKYLNGVVGRAVVKKDGTTTIKSFDGMQSALLKDSLFHENGELFTIDEIEELPSSTQSVFFEESQKLSGLDSDSQDTEKNE